jgi:hypothetical protein
MHPASGALDGVRHGVLRQQRVLEERRVSERQAIRQPTRDGQGLQNIRGFVGMEQFWQPEADAPQA